VWLFAERIKNNFNLFIEFFKKSADEQLIINSEKISFSEFQSLALSANQMVKNHQDAVKEKEQSEERFRRIVENSNDVYFESGLDGNILYCSPSVFDVFGYQQDELIGSHTDIFNKNAADCNVMLELLEKAGNLRHFELFFKKKNGDTFDASVDVDFSLDKNDQRVGYRGTIRDITATNKAKEQLQRSKKMEAIGLMAGGVAHDLNNILSGIIGYPELLLQKLPEQSDLRKPLSAILESGQRAATVVADLLTVARGAATIRKNQDLKNLVEEYIQSPEYQNQQKLYPGVRHQVQLNTESSVISCSPVHIKKCIMNLMLNAAEAIADVGTISIFIERASIDLSANPEVEEYVVLSVCDTGTGISEADLKHVFEPFYTKKMMGRSGTGLGLAVVWNTMEDHKGKVSVTSSKKGSCFKLYFPVSQEIENDQQEEENRTLIHTDSNEHILVVDDEPLLCDIASQILTSLGYRVDIVNSGESAVEFAKNNPVDILILDMLMEPGMNGRQTYEAILQLYPGQKAVIASGFSESDDVKAALQLGVGGFIKKPYSGIELSEVISNTLKL